MKHAADSWRGAQLRMRPPLRSTPRYSGRRACGGVFGPRIFSQRRHHSAPSNIRSAPFTLGRHHGCLEGLHSRLEDPSLRIAQSSGWFGPPAFRILPAKPREPSKALALSARPPARASVEHHHLLGRRHVAHRPVHAVPRNVQRSREHRLLCKLVCAAQVDQRRLGCQRRCDLGRRRQRHRTTQRRQHPWPARSGARAGRERVRASSASPAESASRSLAVAPPPCDHQRRLFASEEGPEVDQLAAAQDLHPKLVRGSFRHAAEARLRWRPLPG